MRLHQPRGVLDVLPFLGLTAILTQLLLVFWQTPVAVVSTDLPGF